MMTWNPPSPGWRMPAPVSHKRYFMEHDWFLPIGEDWEKDALTGRARKKQFGHGPFDVEYCKRCSAVRKKAGGLDHWWWMYSSPDYPLARSAPLRCAERDVELPGEPD